MVDRSPENTIECPSVANSQEGERERKRESFETQHSERREWEVERWTVSTQ